MSIQVCTEEVSLFYCMMCILITPAGIVRPRSFLDCLITCWNLEDDFSVRTTTATVVLEICF